MTESKVGEREQDLKRSTNRDSNSAQRCYTYVCTMPTKAISADISFLNEYVICRFLKKVFVCEVVTKVVAYRLK